MQTGDFLNKPEGCFLEQRSRKAYFNLVKGQASASDQDLSICFAGS